jgi:hypothetical protein
VIESSLGIPTGCAGKLRWQTAGMFGEAALAVKPQWAHYKLDETIEQSCSDFLAHTLEVCKSAHWYNEYSVI